MRNTSVLVFVLVFVALLLFLTFTALAVRTIVVMLLSGVLRLLLLG